jgi:hypothetical protein
MLSWFLISCEEKISKKLDLARVLKLRVTASKKEARARGISDA